MTTSEKLFLVLAEELNFNRAAKKSFISQQALSDHIKRLEQHYDAVLFNRTPVVSLTAAGRSVQRTLQIVQTLEQNLDAELNEIRSGAVGSIRLGINYTRAKLLIPPIFQQYHTKYPNIKIDLMLEETIIMQEMMKRGKLDGFIGVNGHYAAPFAAMPLSSESIYLIASAHYLKRQLGWDPDELVNFRTEVDLEQFRGLPFAMNQEKSTTHQFLKEHMSKADVSIQTILTVSDYQVLEGICRIGEAASFCPQIYLSAIDQGNSFCSGDRKLFALPVRSLDHSIRSELVYNQMLSYPQYITDFFGLLKQSSDEHMKL